MGALWGLGVWALGLDWGWLDRWVLSTAPNPSRGLWAVLSVQIRAGTLDTLPYPMSLSFPN